MGIVDDYLNAVFDERKLFAAYPPNLIVEIGTYGELHGKRFIPRGALRQLRSPINIEPCPIALDRNFYRNEFKLKNARATRVGAGVSVDVQGVTTTKAALKIEFTSGFGAFVGLAGMRVVTARDLAALERELIRRASLPVDDPDHWEARYRVVTHVVCAARATILMSRSAGTKIVLQAKGDVPRFDLANSAAGFDVLYDDTSEDQFAPEGPDPDGCTPFFWLMRLDYGFLGLGRGRSVFEHSSTGDGDPMRRLSLQPEESDFDLSTLER